MTGSRPHRGSPPRRYFDNAATSFPKPGAVAEAVRDYLLRVGASAGRETYAEAVASQRMLDDVRAGLRRVLGAHPADQVVFGLNGSDALNIGIKSLVRPGDHVVTTCMDHNSVLRPLSALERRGGIQWTAVEVDRHTTRLRVEDFAAAIRPGTALAVVNHASNVTGVLQPLADLAEVCRARGVPLLVDAAQSAGHVPIDFSGLGLDMLACPGHKGLLGPLGTGVLLVRAGLGERLQTVREGGTGSQSEHPVQPESMPDKFEAGSHNAPGLAGLLAAIRWIEERTPEALRRDEAALIGTMAEGLDGIHGLAWFGPRSVQERVGVFSIRLAGVAPAELSRILEDDFGILSRSGLHCAPFAHRMIGTAADGGATRLSLGPFLGQDDVAAAIDALQRIARDVQRRRGPAGAACASDRRTAVPVDRAT